MARNPAMDLFFQQLATSPAQGAEWANLAIAAGRHAQEQANFEAQEQLRRDALGMEQGQFEDNLLLQRDRLGLEREEMAAGQRKFERGLALEQQREQRLLDQGIAEEAWRAGTVQRAADQEIARLRAKEECASEQAKKRRLSQLALKEHEKLDQEEMIIRSSDELDDTQPSLFDDVTGQWMTQRQYALQDVENRRLRLPSREEVNSAVQFDSTTFEREIPGTSFKQLYRWDGEKFLPDDLPEFQQKYMSLVPAIQAGIYSEKRAWDIVTGVEKSEAAEPSFGGLAIEDKQISADYDAAFKTLTKKTLDEQEREVVTEPSPEQVQEYLRKKYQTIAAMKGGLSTPTAATADGPSTTSLTAQPPALAPVIADGPTTPTIPPAKIPFASGREDVTAGTVTSAYGTVPKGGEKLPGMSPENPMVFATEAEVFAANPPVGTWVTVGGRPAQVGE
jgi:hypothetical protein